MSYQNSWRKEKYRKELFRFKYFCVMKYYRLRKKNRVMGYAKESISSVVYYKAYNDFQWSEKQMDFDTVDRDIGLKDKKHRRIYEGDIVLYYLSESFVERRGLVQINEETQQAELVDLRQGFITPINVESYNLFEHDKLEVVSHAFTENSELR
ncbi:hypothetical protein HMPREF2660_00500 [Weeksella sp. HMSC059D05]|nr:hypothetical protein HMPREF2660_00500 [Weeksella sp. HMSC059D05]